MQKAFAVTFPLDAQWAPKEFSRECNWELWAQVDEDRSDGKVVCNFLGGRGRFQKFENGAGRVCVGDVWQVAKSRGEEPGLRGGGWGLAQLRSQLTTQKLPFSPAKL